MNQILDRLWCGNFEDGEAVAQKRILSPVNFLLNLSQYTYNSPTFIMLHRPIEDEVFLSPETWEALTHRLTGFIHTRRHHVLVHCRLGKSRAPSLCAAYLVRCGWDPESALQHVLARRPEADPHPETWRSVIAWAKGH